MAIGKKKNNIFIRFGEIPENERSGIYVGEDLVSYEDGVSVFPAFYDSDKNVCIGITIPVTKTSLYTLQSLVEYESRPCYLVSGDVIGRGADNEPLIKNVKIIEKIDKYRVKSGQ